MKILKTKTIIANLWSDPRAYHQEIGKILQKYKKDQKQIILKLKYQMGTIIIIKVKFRANKEVNILNLEKISIKPI